MSNTLAVAALALLFAVTCDAYLVNPGACSKPNGVALKDVCEFRAHGFYCWPCDTAKYVKCHGTGVNELLSCKSGLIFDYNTHLCLPKADAHPCPNDPCPSIIDRGLLVPGPGISGPLGAVSFSLPGNATIKLNQTDEFWVVCPVQGHCNSGMLFKVTVGPAAAVSTVHSVDWMEVTTNAKLGTGRLPDITASVGDSLFIAWDEPPHAVAILRPELLIQPTMPEPPQPTYICPSDLPFPVFGPTSLVALNGFGNITIMINTTGSYGLVCTIPGHCRMGMYFTVTATQRLLGSTPTKFLVNWIHMTPMADLNVHVGDSIQVSWEGQTHNLVQIPVLEKYPYAPGIVSPY